MHGCGAAQPHDLHTRQRRTCMVTMHEKNDVNQGVTVNVMTSHQAATTVLAASSLERLQ